MLPVEPDLEPVERPIELKREVAGVTKWIQVAMPHQEDAQVQGLWGRGWKVGQGGEFSSGEN